MANLNAEARRDVEVALAAVAGKFISDPVPKPDGGSVLFHGIELKAHELAPLNPTLPGFVTQTETVIEPASFVDYIRSYKSETAICRASLGSNKIEAVLDYHGQARKGDALAAVPQRAKHIVTLLCPYDLDYAKWKKVLGQPLDQAELAEVLEDLVHTIGMPPAADILEAINDLKIDRQVKFKSARNIENGTVRFTYEEVDAEQPGDAGQVTLPKEVQIIVPIFQGGDAVQITAKLRHRLDRGKVVFILAVPGLDKIERDIFRSLAEKVRADTVTPVFYTV